MNRISPYFQLAVFFFLGTTLLAGSVLSTVSPAQLPSTIDLTSAPGDEGTPVLRVYGVDWFDYAASAAHGDINGDGFDDLGDSE